MWSRLTVHLTGRLAETTFWSRADSALISHVPQPVTDRLYDLHFVVIFIFSWSSTSQDSYNQRLHVCLSFGVGLFSHYRPLSQIYLSASCSFLLSPCTSHFAVTDVLPTLKPQLAIHRLCRILEAQIQHPWGTVCPLTGTWVENKEVRFLSTMQYILVWISCTVMLRKAKRH